MHELPLVESALRIVLAHAARGGASRVLGVALEVGELCDALPEWIERYFRAAARGSIAEGAALTIVREKAAVACAACGSRFPPPARPAGPIACPSCGSRDCSLAAGLEWRVASIEVE